MTLAFDNYLHYFGKATEIDGIYLVTDTLDLTTEKTKFSDFAKIFPSSFINVIHSYGCSEFYFTDDEHRKDVGLPFLEYCAFKNRGIYSINTYQEFPKFYIKDGYIEYYTDNWCASEGEMIKVVLKDKEYKIVLSRTFEFEDQNLHTVLRYNNKLLGYFKFPYRPDNRFDYFMVDDVYVRNNVLYFRFENAVFPVVIGIDYNTYKVHVKLVDHKYSDAIVKANNHLVYISNNINEKMFTKGYKVGGHVYETVGAYSKFISCVAQSEGVNIELVMEILRKYLKYTPKYTSDDLLFLRNIFLSLTGSKYADKRLKAYCSRLLMMNSNLFNNLDTSGLVEDMY